MEIKRRLILIVIAVFCVIMIGTIGYYIIYQGNSTFMDCLFMTVISLTTVGYGDIAPVTILGKILASIAMLTGFSIIAVPTGVISVEISKAVKAEGKNLSRTCTNCGFDSHDQDAVYCKICCTKL